MPFLVVAGKESTLISEGSGHSNEMRQGDKKITIQKNQISESPELGIKKKHLNGWVPGHDLPKEMCAGHLFQMACRCTNVHKTVYAHISKLDF